MKIPFSTTPEIKEAARQRIAAVEAALAEREAMRQEIPSLKETLYKLQRELAEFESAMEITNTQDFITLHARRHQIEAIQSKIYLLENAGLAQMEERINTAFAPTRALFAEALEDFRRDLHRHLFEVLAPFYRTEQHATAAVEATHAAQELKRFMYEITHSGRPALRLLALLAEGKCPFEFQAATNPKTNE